ncbi:MFS transporter [Streptomyces orinoci]|uniref:MFS transporter n=1 Tax=Streptomyces orinoci TaxID=67339 RepID=A0ABV3JR30_STRON|nr:MFS transporter [Streptomyces orinoci]
MGMDTVTVTAPGRHRWLVLATLCSGLFMAMLDNLVVGTALPSIAARLHTGTSGLQWVVEAYSLVYAALLLTGGALGDRWGRRPAYLAGLGLFTAGSTVCACADGLQVLVGGRALQGLGAALLTPGSLAVLRQVFPDERERARAIGIWSGVSGSGLALGPALGGPLVDRFGWSSVFWINVPVGMAGLALAAWVLPRLPRAAGARFDLPGQVTGAAGLGALVYALVEGPVRGWSAPWVLGAAAAAVVALAAFLAVELRAPAPMLDVRVLTHRVTGTAAWAGFTAGFGFFGLGVFLALYLQSVLGLSPARAGWAMLPATMATGATAVVAGGLCARYGPRLPLAAGLGLIATALALLTRYGADAHYAQFAWLMPVMGAGLGLTFTPISVAVLEAVPAARAGTASAVVNMFREVGGVAGVAVMGAVLAARSSGTSVSRSPGSGTIRPEAAHAYVAGLHAAVLVGAGCVGLMAGAVLVLMRGSRGD